MRIAVIARRGNPLASSVMTGASIASGRAAVLASPDDSDIAAVCAASDLLIGVGLAGAAELLSRFDRPAFALESTGALRCVTTGETSPPFRLRQFQTADAVRWAIAVAGSPAAATATGASPLPARNADAALSVVVHAQPGLSVFERIAEGLTAALGASPRVSLLSTREPEIDPAATLAVIRGVRDRCGRLFSSYRAAGINVALIDAGWWPDNETHVRLCFNGLSWIPRGPFDDSRARAQGLVCSPVKSRRPDGPVLMLGQMQGDPGHSVDAHEWAEHALAVIRSVTSRRVIWRPHPRDQWRLAGADGYDMRGRGKSGAMNAGLTRSIEGAWAVVTHNSSAAIEAIRLGVPVFCNAAAAYVGAARTDPAELEDAMPPAREEAQAMLNRIAHGQWSLDELATAEPWNLLVREIGRAADAPRTREHGG